MHQVLIVGTGFAGIGMGIRLLQAGIDDFVILEAASDLGGTWRDNHYPGAACDVQSHLYSFSFEPNPRWTRMFAPQKEILEYLRHCATKYGVTPHIRYGAAVASAVWDERTGVWTVTTKDGRTFRARAVVSGCGGLSRAKLPDIPGLADFEGKAFHTQRWDDGFSAEGKTVAVIGTGASAIQVVPEIAPKASRLFVFQRTPPWIMPKPDREISSRERALFARVPALQSLARKTLYWQREALALGFVKEPRILKLAEKLAKRFLAESVKDHALRAKLSPSYAMGCKRILPTNDWYPALQRPNVELVTDGIARIRADGIETVDGRHRAVDAIVLATGFEAAEACAPFEVRGRDGRELSEVWRAGAEAYLGTAVSGFPNMFMIVGPNTGLGHSSMILMIESQVEYILGAVSVMRAKKLKAVDVRLDVQQRYNAEIHGRLDNSVWASGCVSWYRTASGKNTTLWPGFTFEFKRRTREFDVAAYHVLAESDHATAAGASASAE